MIHKLGAPREGADWVKKLHGLHRWLSTWAQQARVHTNPVMSGFVREQRNQLVQLRDDLDAYKTANAAFFVGRYPEEATAGNAAISSLTNIVAAMDTLRSNYMENGVFSDVEVSQADLNTMATAIEAELES